MSEQTVVVVGLFELVIEREMCRQRILSVIVGYQRIFACWRRFLWQRMPSHGVGSLAEDALSRRRREKTFMSVSVVMRRTAMSMDDVGRRTMLFLSAVG